LLRKEFQLTVKMNLKLGVKVTALLLTKVAMEMTKKIAGPSQFGNILCFCLSQSSLSLKVSKTKF
jgi:hypothetical protein